MQLRVENGPYAGKFIIVDSNRDISVGTALEGNSIFIFIPLASNCDGLFLAVMVMQHLIIINAQEKFYRAFNVILYITVI